MKKLVLIGLVATLGLAAVANAQYGKPQGISLRGGMFFPSAASAKLEGKTWFGIGIDYKIRDLGYARTPDDFDTSYVLSLDYYGKGDHSNMPLTINWVSRRDAFYYSAGAGLGFAKTPDGVGGTDTQTELAYSVAVGFEFQQMQTPFFVEARYFGSAESALNGFGVFAGLRF